MNGCREMLEELRELKELESVSAIDGLQAIEHRTMYYLRMTHGRENTVNYSSTLFALPSYCN